MLSQLSTIRQVAIDDGYLSARTIGRARSQSGRVMLILSRHRSSTSVLLVVLLQVLAASTVTFTRIAALNSSAPTIKTTQKRSANGVAT